MKLRSNTIELDKSQFKKIGYQLIDQIANFIETVDQNPITTAKTPSELQKQLEQTTFPEKGRSPEELMSYTTELLLKNSLFNSHPKFMGYITSSPAPIGILADLLASAINQNVGAQILSPIATEIEKQTVKWLAEFIGVSSSYGGILVSGGNMANFTGFLAGRTEKAPKSIKEEGISNSDKKLTVYCSKSTHTWVDKAAILFGLGSNAIRWIPTTSTNQMDIMALEKRIASDLANGNHPMMIVGTAGDVSTGVVDDLNKLNEISKKHNMWFHIDGAYGIPAAVIPSLKSMFEGVEGADSIALDPHKWLYSPLEAGCTLVKDPQHLINTFSSHPEYYKFDNMEGETTHNFYEYGLQNSRGFRALKVWMALQQIGREGYVKLISEDIALSKMMFDLANAHPEIDALTQNLSIATFRYVPLHHDLSDLEYLNKLNDELLSELQKGGEVFLSNAIISEKYCMRACIVNFRTAEKDINEIIEMVVIGGRKVHARLLKQ